ncbi:hypothetical protein GCM10009808_07430 [Microbacterium sediminicola]|uniref:Uncharacterized protein n=1 Tax=Microbacterium sediminicola TaxID=415210 RepID=A0ABN2HT97_9MICO
MEPKSAAGMPGSVLLVVQAAGTTGVGVGLGVGVLVGVGVGVLPPEFEPPPFEPPPFDPPPLVPGVVEVGSGVGVGDTVAVGVAVGEAVRDADGCGDTLLVGSAVGAPATHPVSVAATTTARADTVNGRDIGTSEVFHSCKPQPCHSGVRWAIIAATSSESPLGDPVRS